MEIDNLLIMEYDNFSENMQISNYGIRRLPNYGNRSLPARGSSGNEETRVNGPRGKFQMLHLYFITFNQIKNG